MASNENYEIPGSGAIFTFGRSGFADNQQSHFFIRNDPVVEISCGDEHTAVICQNGRVFLFGHNDYGQLGFGHTRTITKPSCLKYLKPFHSTHVACGKGHTIVSTQCGRLFSFGSNSDGQLGTGDLNDKFTPQLVHTKHFGEVGISAVAAGCFHSACLTDKGELYVWGNNSDGQCGFEVDTNLLTPTKVEFDCPISGISCGYYHTAFISEGRLFTFGEEDNGKLGYRRTSNSNLPEKVKLDFKIVRVVCGGNHTLILSEEGRVYGCGSNFSGQLGLSNRFSECYSPTPIDIPDKIVYVAAGESHSAFITEDGELYTCGDGRYGKTCSDDDSANFTSPNLISLFSDFHCDSVSCGGCQTMVMARPKSSDDINVSALPPLKVPKTLIISDEIPKGEVKCREINDEEAGKERFIEAFDNLNTAVEDKVEEESVLISENMCVDTQEMKAPGRNGNDNETQKVDHTENPAESRTPENVPHPRSGVIARNESRIKNLLSTLKRTGAPASGVSRKNGASINENCNEKKHQSAEGKNVNHQKSKTCSII